MYLLDTNIVSESRRPTPYNGALFDWLASINSSNLYICSVVLMELERGVLSMERKDMAQGKVLRRWLNEVVEPAFASRILVVGCQTARICANLYVPDKAPENDAWIAACAIEHRLTLVTCNSADFERTGVKLFNPFSG